MIALLADEDFNHRIVRGLLRRVPDLDLLTVTDAGLSGQRDDAVISWAADNRRVLLTHDLNTMINAALDRVRAGQPMPGVLGIPQQLSIGASIADLELIATTAEPDEIAGQVWYLPL